MTKYERLLIESEKQGVNVIEVDLGTKKKCGKYLSNNKENIAIINSNIGDIEKYEVLAEELGHHNTSYGNIIDQSNFNNIKQEKRARRWSYEKLVGIVSLINAFEKGIRNRHELAEHLDVTEFLLDEAIKYYREKYGICLEIDNYLIYFEPYLTILKTF